MKEERGENEDRGNGGQALAKWKSG